MVDKITVTVFKVSGETNTDDLSPAPDEAGKLGPLKLINTLKEKGFPLVYVGDVVGTGSSRKSGTNSVLWHMGEDIPFIPNKREGGFCFGGDPNRLGDGAFVYLASAELAAVASIISKLPTMDEYMSYVSSIDPIADDIYRYLNFNEIESYQHAAEKVIPIVAV